MNNLNAFYRMPRPLKDEPPERISTADIGKRIGMEFAKFYEQNEPPLVTNQEELIQEIRSGKMTDERNP